MVTAKKTGQGEPSLRDNLTRLIPAIGTPHATQNPRVRSVTPYASRKSPESSRLPTDNAGVQPAPLNQQGWLDDLPHLPNRAQFSHHLQQAILTAQRRNKPLALLLINLDHFREVNVTFSHQWGEVLLQQVGSRLRNALRKSDIVARLGGDEFAVLLASGGNEKGATRVAGRIIRALEQPFVIAGYTVDVGVRVGIA